jgi:hypothetical protein
VVRLGLAEHAAGLRRCLLPFAGLFATDNGVSADVPVDAQLAALALLEGDVPAAVAHAQRGLAQVRRLPSAPLEARCLQLLALAQQQAGDHAAAASAGDAAEALAEPLGMALANAMWVPGGRAPAVGAVARLAPAGARAGAGAVGAGPGLAEAELHREGPNWRVASPHGGGVVADSVGMGQLAALLQVPGVEVAAVDLAGASEPGRPPVAADLGPTLDARAKREYRQRVAELQAEIDEADDHHDPERAAKARLELDALLDELRRAVGLGGRDRPQGSGAEKARINVARSLRRAIAAVGAAVPDLGAHLAVSVRTGHRCAYAPEPAAALRWTITP